MSQEWREHPNLLGRFHPESPDDLQVIVHDGGPRMTDRCPELVWVRVTGSVGETYIGQVLNQPHQLAGVSAGSMIRFVVPQGGEHPLQVREKYQRERGDWIIHPCSKCGLTELFDAPSDLMREVFPDSPPDAVMTMFTAFCGACGGIQVVQHNSHDAEDDCPEDQRSEKPWWRFWK